MSGRVVEKLREVGVDLDTTDSSRFRYQVRSAGVGSQSRDINELRRANPTPAVSCLMVTRGDLDLLQYSLACYQRQTYARRELVIVTDVPTAPIIDFVRARGTPNVVVVGLPRDPALTLGDLRNAAVARARGDIIVQWDDDDLFDPHRIEILAAVLRQSGATAAFLARWLVWWPARNLAALSRPRLWEGSIAAWRDAMPAYPAAARGEDSAVVDHLSQRYPVVLIDLPWHYVYAITGRNTWHDAHFEKMITTASCVFRDDDFVAFNQLLSARLPILEYEATLRRR